MSRPLEKPAYFFGRLLNTEQMRRYLGEISEASLKKWIQQGFLPEPRQECPSGHHYWDRMEVDEWLDRAFGRNDNERKDSIGKRYRESR